MDKTILAFHELGIANHNLVALRVNAAIMRITGQRYLSDIVLETAMSNGLGVPIGLCVYWYISAKLQLGREMAFMLLDYLLENWQWADGIDRAVSEVRRRRGGSRLLTRGHACGVDMWNNWTFTRFYRGPDVPAFQGLLLTISLPRWE